MKIGIASDHGGFDLKSEMIPFLRESGHTVVDFGTHSLASCDYPDFGVACAEAVARGECERGIVICKTGIGMSIAANKIPGIRCALCFDAASAEATRLHNDANVLALGASSIGVQEALETAKVFLETPFSQEERHCRRLGKIAETERKYMKREGLD